MNKTYLQRGFTLIELLVVIAIIGILSAVVMAALSSTRTQGNNKKIISQLVNMRSQAGLYSGTGTAFDPDNAPGGTAPGDVGTCSVQSGTIFDSNNNGMGKLFPTPLTNSRCVSQAGLPFNGSAWAVSFPITGGAWCVDSTGVSRGKTLAGTAYTGTSDAILNATSKCQ